MKISDDPSCRLLCRLPEHLHAVSSVVLGLVERLIHLFQQRVEINGLEAGNGEAYAYGYVQRFGLSGYRGFHESHPKPLRNLERLLQRRFRQGNDEFFSTVAGEYINSSQSGAADCGYHVERFVANRMTVSVINLLEMIKIYHHES